MSPANKNTSEFSLGWLLLACLTLVFSSPAAAVVLYGTSTGFGTGGNANNAGGGGAGPGTGPGNFSQFHQIDLNTGVATQISSDIGYGGDVGGLAADSNNVLYAGSGGRGPNNLGRVVDESQFFTIDPVTGLGNPVIGPLGIEFAPFDQFGSRRQNIAGWSFDPNSGDLYGMTGRGAQLFVADLNTGAATRIGTPCPADPGGNATSCGRGNAIAFDPAGSLLWSNGFELLELDPTTGQGTGPGTILDYDVFGNPNDPNAPFRVVAMDFHPLTGELYTAVQQGVAGNSDPILSTLAILDPSLGTFNIIGSVDGTGTKLNGIAFVNPNPVPVPAAFWLFGTALAGFIGISRRRKLS